MNKVLIDQELLERVQERLDPHRDAVLWGDVCDTFRSAPSGTPAMPVKAYYHEWTDLEGVRTRSVGLEVRKEFTDAPLVLESDALARITCLEGEIAKRDEELAACRVAVENCELFRARIVELEAEVRRWVIRIQQRGLEMDDLSEELKVAHTNISRLDDLVLSLQCKVIERDAELAAIKAQEPVSYTYASKQETQCAGCGIRKHTPLRVDEMGGYVCLTCIDKKLEDFYAAPVSEAKAQAVVMPERWNVPRPMWKDARQPYGNPLNHADIEAAEKFNLALDEVVRLNAAPAAPAADAWIPVGERLPEPGEPVQVWCEGAEQPGLAWISRHADWSGEWVIPEPQAIGYESITHWMPLPAAPSAHSAKGVV